MADGNTSGGNSKSRSVLGDITNWNDLKRGISGKGKSVDFKDIDGGKRFRICTEVNAFKGNAISAISKIPDENRDPNLGNGNVNVAAVRSSIGVDLDCDGSDCLKGEMVVMGSSKVHGECCDISILHVERKDESQSVTNLDSTDNNCFKIDCLGDVSSPMVCKITSQDDIHSASSDVERGRFNNVVAEADGCGELHLSKGNTSSEVVLENQCPRIEFSVTENVADVSPGISKVSNKGNGPNLANLGTGDAFDRIDVNVNETGEGCPCPANICVRGEENKILEGTQSDINVKEVGDQNAENLILSQSSMVNPESSAFGVGSPFEGGDCAYGSRGIESIRDCSCSFCTKAALVWLDLHHQDIKGRVSAIRKSQKEAGLLAERSCRNKFTERHGAERIAGVWKMESHLTNQWRCLFQGMADIWEEEGNRLEGNLQTLVGLRDKCKADLGSMDSKPSQHR